MPRQLAHMYIYINIGDDMENNESKNKRLIIDIPAELHKDIKIRSATKNISIRTWVVRAIVQAIEKEKKYE